MFRQRVWAGKFTAEVCQPPHDFAGCTLGNLKCHVMGTFIAEIRRPKNNPLTDLPAACVRPKLSRVEIEIINTGSELLLGRVLNTHQQWLCRRLADLGHIVTRQVAVPDTAPDIQQAVREALARADLLIVTGGLGPTSDDITRDLIAKLLGKKLVRDEQVFAHIKNYFAARKRPMPANNDVQALVPEGATVLLNPNGTAPGLAMKIGEDGGWKMEDGKESPRPILRPQSPSAFPEMAHHAARAAARIAADV